MKKHILPGIILLIIVTSCSDYDLNKSIFIPDKLNPDLPAYTEWGYNTFGAYYDREPFVNDNSSVPAKIISTGGVTSFTLMGHFGEYGYYHYSGEDAGVTLTIEIPGFLPGSRADLLELDNAVINLDDPQCRVFITRDGIEHEAGILTGSLHFKRVQNLIVDKEPAMTILSGTFEFQALIEDVPTSVTDGRFDLGFDADNFFVY